MSMIKILAKPILFLRRKIDRFTALYLNQERYKNSKISKIEYELRKIFLEKTIGQTNMFYQSYPPLKITGERGTLCRFKAYEMDKFLNKKMNVLDVGGNVGFFTAFIAKYVKSIEMIEVIDYFIEIARKLAKYEKIQNMKVYFTDFKKLDPKKKYDLILSFAVHDIHGTNKSRVEMEFQKYLDKLASHLKKRGLVAFESHGIFHNGGEKDIEERIKLNKNFTIVKKGFVDDFGGLMRQFFWLKKM